VLARSSPTVVAGTGRQEDRPRRHFRSPASIVPDADGRLTETVDRYHVVRQAVPDGGSGDWEGPAADGRKFNGTRALLLWFIYVLQQAVVLAYGGDALKLGR